MAIKTVQIPYEPRQWACGFHRTVRRFISLILHRRAGKTTAILNHHIWVGMNDEWEKYRLRSLQPTLTDKQLEELIHPPGGRHYGHVMPTRVQAKMVAWDKLKYYASPLGGKPNESELLYRLPNGNKVQLFGADDPDSMRGFGGSGLSFDEFSQQPSNIFSEVLSKALGERLGYAIFAGTIKGKDHLYQTWRAAKNTPDLWFALWQDVNQSLATESGITIQLLKQAMADDRSLIEQGLMTQEEYDQEWFLSLEAAIKGAYYATQMSKARQDGRIGIVEYDPDFPVFTAWDLGRTDDTAIWFYQNIGNEIRVIDVHAESGGDLEQYVNDRPVPGTITREVLGRPYRYERHWLPHDAKAKTLAANGKSAIEQLTKYLGVGRCAIVPELSVEDGIKAARAIFGRCWFDEKHCEKGLNALLHYKRKYDNKADVFSKTPVHDWCLTGETPLLTRYGMQRIMDLPIRGEILTSCGWKEYERPRITRRNAPLVEVAFRDGYSVRCTPDHLFKTAKGWKYANDLTPNTMIQSGLTHSLSTLMAVSFDYGRRKRILRGAVRSFIESLGSGLSVLFPRGVTSTIEMAIQRIINSSISNAFPQNFTYKRLGADPWRVASNPFQTKHGMLPQYGTPPKRAGYGIVDTRKDQNPGLNGNGNRVRVWVVAMCSIALSVKMAISKNIAARIVKPLRIASVRELQDRSDVWCLTVPSCDEFCLANGAIVHNSSHYADAWRMLSVAERRPEEKPKPQAPGKTLQTITLDELWQWHEEHMNQEQRI